VSTKENKHQSERLKGGYTPYGNVGTPQYPQYPYNMPYPAYPYPQQPPVPPVAQPPAAPITPGMVNPAAPPAAPIAPGIVNPATPPTPTTGVPGMLPVEESYIENILRLNRGKIGTFYFTYENNTEWNSKIYRGRIEAAGRDHIVLSDPQTGKRYLLLMVNFDYAEFDDRLNYEYPYAAPRPGVR
jgi:spore germination protein Q